MDWVAVGTALERGAEVHSPLYADALRWSGQRAVRTAAGGTNDVRLVVDVGAGPGVITCLLAERNPLARVIAIDGSAALLDRAAQRAVRLGLQDRVETRLVDLPGGLDDLADKGAAEVVLASHFLHHLGDQQGALRRVGDLLRARGVLGIAA